MRLRSVTYTFGFIFSVTSALAQKPSAKFVVAVIPEKHYSAVAVHEMSREASNILKRSGVTITWRLGSDVQVVDQTLLVVKLRGECSMDMPASASMKGALGWTHKVDGKLLPFCELSCDSIRGGIRSADIHLPGDFLLGRAMGRVLAHELYHIIGNTSTHGREGIAQPSLSVGDLVLGRMELDPADEQVIQDRVQSGR